MRNYLCHKLPKCLSGPYDQGMTFEEAPTTCPACETEMDWDAREGCWHCPDPNCDWLDV